MKPGHQPQEAQADTRDQSREILPLEAQEGTVLDLGSLYFVFLVLFVANRLGR